MKTLGVSHKYNSLAGSTGIIRSLGKPRGKSLSAMLPVESVVLPVG